MAGEFYPVSGFGGFYTIIEQWNQFGVFTILMPLMLVFAVVFAILEKVNIFNNKGVHLIIALVVGFFTVSNPYVSSFFMPLFSNLGLGVAILLVFLVLIGLAIKPEDKSWPYLFGIVGGIIFIVILARTGGLRLIFGDNIQYWLQQNSAWMILFVFLILIGVAVVVGVRKEENDIRIPRS